MKQQAHRCRDDPAALRAMFLGWIQQLHAEVRDTFAALNASDAEFQQHWHTVATEFANRFRSEVLTASYASETDQIFSDNDIARIVADVDGMANDFMHSAEADLDASLDQAVNAVRAAEEAGRLAPDPRSDRELKESIRQMWDEDLNERAQ